MLSCTAKQRVFYKNSVCDTFGNLEGFFSIVSEEKYISITSNLVITDVVYGLVLNEEG